jgi:hypothetical protein
MAVKQDSLKRKIRKCERVRKILVVIHVHWNDVTVEYVNRRTDTKQVTESGLMLTTPTTLTLLHPVDVFFPILLVSSDAGCCGKSQPAPPLIAGT